MTSYGAFTGLWVFRGQGLILSRQLAINVSAYGLLRNRLRLNFFQASFLLRYF